VYLHKGKIKDQFKRNTEILREEDGREVVGLKHR
jgi:hypothetical protein